ncbi:cytochrome P450 [Dictyobacter formicarum]|uniref:Cytochrome P450 n=1 Tax=Dictyobacter formicarum TaxID=2778368 RepID=A0ABQ3VI13_9CHLR|nr:cytochrome P450 [Dictyobacter formicarum]GHO85817.1 cytochrome P450 [Dictyobacter formicarum]
MRSLILPASLHGTQEIFAWFQYSRAVDPVMYEPTTNKWHVFGYRDAVQVLNDAASFSSALERGGPIGTALLASTMIAQDPPEHQWLRALVSQVFTEQTFTRLAPRIRVIAQNLLDIVRSAGYMDAIQDFAYPLPMTIISELLGIPLEQRPAFRRWSDCMFFRQQERSESQSEQDEPYQQALAARQAMSESLLRLLQQRRQKPRDDLISQLLVAEVDGKRLSEQQLVGVCFLFWAAGHETAVNLLGNAVLCLDDHPEEAERLRHDFALLPGAIEEILRYSPPLLGVTRCTTREVVVGGKHIEAGQHIRVWIASANRDAEIFFRPDRFNIERDPNPHLTFGQGIHNCLGAPLARLEVSIALPLLLHQLPALRRVCRVPLQWVEGGTVYGVRHLPLEF